jgi:hypothetical protein
MAIPAVTLPAALADLQVRLEFGFLSRVAIQ